jgi:hypothetical protein
VSNERLTRQEISWLLAQEARGAAKALRQEVTRLTNPPPGVPAASPEVPEVRVSLDALDDAIGLLSQLQSDQRAPKVARRGRIDVASLLCKVAPNARIALAPGEGTEVFGEEGELSRLLHVLLSQALGADANKGSPDIEVKREGDMVKISVDLGPDSSTTQAVEKRWLSRMAIRHGGRLEYKEGRQSVLLPADGASDQREVVELRKELAQAQMLGEAYARELATALSDEAPEAAQSPSTPSGGSLDLVVSLAAALDHSLKDTVVGALRAAQALKPRLAAQDEDFSALHTRLLALQALGSELALVGECDVSQPGNAIDIQSEVAAALEARKSRLSRRDMAASSNHEGALQGKLLVGPFRLLLHSLIEHAALATPRGGAVNVSSSVSDGDVTLRVSDGGPSIPSIARLDLLKGRVDATSMGRPGGISLLVAHAAAGHLGGTLGLGQNSAGANEVRARVPTLP